jgi:hypothetical protein
MTLAPFMGVKGAYFTALTPARIIRRVEVHDRQMRHGMNRLHSYCHDAPPIVAFFDGIIAQCSLIS